jgi:hypothetical protein
MNIQGLDGGATSGPPQIKKLPIPSSCIQEALGKAFWIKQNPTCAV